MLRQGKEVLICHLIPIWYTLRVQELGFYQGFEVFVHEKDFTKPADPCKESEPK